MERGLRTLEVGHVGPDVRVQGVDDHLPVSRSGNLNSAIDETWSWWCSPPCVILADVLSLWQKVELGALVELHLADLTSLEKVLARGIESTVEESKESSGILRQDGASLVIERSKDLDVLEDLFLVCSRHVD